MAMLHVDRSCREERARLVRLAGRPKSTRRPRRNETEIAPNAPIALGVYACMMLLGAQRAPLPPSHLIPRRQGYTHGAKLRASHCKHCGLESADQPAGRLESKQKYSYFVYSENNITAGRPAGRNQNKNSRFLVYSENNVTIKPIDICM